MHCTHASASRVKTFKECAFKFFLEYHIMYPPMKTGNIYAEKGSAVHHALERYVNALLGKTENAERDWAKSLREYYAEKELWVLDARKPEKGFPHPQEKTCITCPAHSKDGFCAIANKPALSVNGCPRPHYEEDEELILKTLTRSDYNPFLLDDSGHMKKKVIGVELPFDMELGGVPSKGFMDLVVEDDENTIEVIDYKTGRAMSYDKMQNDPQVRIYAAVARILYPQYKFVMVTLHYLKQRPVSHIFSEDDDILTLEALQKAYHEITTSKNPSRKENWLCNFCVTFENCGKIHAKFVVDGKFRLPTISCAYRKDGEICWGSIYPDKTLQTTIENVHQMTYSCKGHSEVSSGGIYKTEVKEEPVVDISEIAG